MDWIIDDNFRVTFKTIFRSISDLLQGGYQWLCIIQNEHMDMHLSEDGSILRKWQIKTDL
jgi:hypothetical protein